MTDVQRRQHIVRRYHEELEAVHSRAMAMGGLVEHQLAQVLAALIDKDGHVAATVVRDDHRVNALEVGIDEACTQILAKRQPTASDLRLVVAVVKTITDLERIGDEVTRIGRFLLDLTARGHCPVREDEIMGIGRRVKHMLHGALDAFARMDVQLALEVARQDGQVDREYEAILRQMMARMAEDPRSIPAALDVIWCLRALERIGDRSCNICEYVIYFVKGKDVRHTSLEQMEDAVRSSR